MRRAAVKSLPVDLVVLGFANTDKQHTIVVFTVSDNNTVQKMYIEPQTDAEVFPAVGGLYSVCTRCHKIFVWFSDNK